MFKKAILAMVLLVFSLSFMQGQGEPVVYLEFSDFSHFLSELERNKSYREFMGSSVVEWYKNSRLGLKFPERIKEFEEVLGFGLSLQNINSLAGKETGIWLFDIGELKMLMITTIPEGEYLRSRIAKSRDQFGEGKIDTITFYFKKDESGNKEVDFAFLNNLLIISNEPAVFEQCVKRLATDANYLEWKSNDFLGWMEEGQKEEYEMLLYLSSESVRNTYFTSYWFHGNQKEIRSWFDSGVILVSKGEKEIVEKRIYRLLEGFAFDSLALVSVPKLFSVVPEEADMVKIRPVSGEGLIEGLRKLLGGGTSMDSLIASVEAMHPLAYGHFAIVTKGDVVPTIAEGFAVIVQDPDKGIVEQFNAIYPANLRTHALFSRNMPDFTLEGDLLLFASKRDFFKKPKPITQKGLMSYASLNFQRFADAFGDEIELLGESERWSSYENRDFFTDNIDDVVRVLRSTGTSIESKGMLNNDILEYRITYRMK